MAAECHTADEFDQHLQKALESKKLVVIDFTATWCGHSRVIDPVFAEIAKKTPRVVFLKVDVDELKVVFTKYKVQGMSTFLFLKEGKEVHRLVGPRKEELAAKITEYGTVAASSS